MRKHQIKMNRAIENYTGFKGAGTLDAIKSQVPEELIERLTGKELALVMQAINAAYQKGRASTGAEMIDNNAVYINKLNKMKKEQNTSIGKSCTLRKNSSAKTGKEVYIPESKSRVPVKIKDGALVPRFSE